MPHLVTINDLAQVAVYRKVKMLSDFTSSIEPDFWEDYKNNFIQYDKQFARMFKSFWYFNQEPVEEFDYTSNNAFSLLNEFTDAVLMHLTLNDKKYHELYRVHLLSDDLYSLVNNYDVTETRSSHFTDNSNDIYGSRNDNTVNVEGSRNDTATHSDGSRNDSRQSVKGSEIDSHTQKVSPYDSENFFNNSQTSDEYGIRNDSETYSKGEQNDSDNMTKGEQTNNENYSKGEQKDSHDSTKEEIESYAKKGNIGVMTVTDMLQKHKDFWSTWEFYNYIFKMIVADLCLVN